MEKIFFLIFFVKNNSKSFEKKNPYHTNKTPIIQLDLRGQTASEWQFEIPPSLLQTGGDF